MRSNDQCTYELVSTDDEVSQGDIVFCQVQPADTFYAYHAKKKEVWGGTGKYSYTIANLKGRENGWCYIEHIYGRLAEVLL